MKNLDTTLRGDVLSFVYRLWSSSRASLVATILLISSLGASYKAVAQIGAIGSDAITISQKPTSEGSAKSFNYAGSTDPDDPNNPNYPSLGQPNNNSYSPPQLGTYDLDGNSVLVLTGATLAGTISSSMTYVTATRTQYRVYLEGTTEAMKPSYSNLDMTWSQTQISAVYPYSSTFTGTGINENINLLAGLTSGGKYILDIRFQADASRGSYSTQFVDSQGGSYYYANFIVTSPAVTPTGGTTTWQGVANGRDANGQAYPLSSDTDWLNTNNWTNGVPTRSSNAIIPEKSSSLIVYPILNSPTATYEVNDLSLQGSLNSTASQLSINTATLKVYGNISQESDGITGNTTGTIGATDPTRNSTIILAGANQVITGNVVVSDIIIAGSGIKSFTNQLTPTNIFAFRPESVTAGVIAQSAVQRVSNGPFVTQFSTNGRAYVQLVSSSTISTVLGEAETNVSYIRGVTRADRQVTSGELNTFGNIGLDITANHPSNNIIVYRIVGDALGGPDNSTAKPIKRQYEVVGDDNSLSSAFANSTTDIVFHYLDSGPDTNSNELNGTEEQNLTMYRTVNNGAPYQPLGGTLNTSNNTVTRISINSLPDYKLVLGDKTNPLPVSLTAFTATRTNTNAVLAWTTASELNNTGFEVQVSSDGVTYRKLAFVASQNPNSVQVLNYGYTDTENGKTGTRYYRLRQIDISGEESFSPPRPISFSGATSVSAGLAAYPNPFVDKLDFNLDATAVGSGVARVQLVDMTGRMVREQNVSVANASLSLDGLSGLGSGLYMAKVTLPDGTSQTVRIQKQ